MFWRKKREEREPEKIEPELKRQRKHFTTEELERIREMVEKNMKVREIAGELGRTEKSIYNFIYKQKLRTRLKESLPKLAEEEANRKKNIEDLDNAIKERENRLKALDEQIKTKEDELRTLQEDKRIEELRKAIDYYQTKKGLEELKRYMEVHKIQIVGEGIADILRTLSIKF
jgi:uncharacterized Ntn-hydrolase superfamily protein